MPVWRSAMKVPRSLTGNTSGSSENRLPATSTKCVSCRCEDGAGFRHSLKTEIGAVLFPAFIAGVGKEGNVRKNGWFDVAKQRLFKHDHNVWAESRFWKGACGLFRKGSVSQKPVECGSNDPNRSRQNNKLFPMAFFSFTGVIFQGRSVYGRFGCFFPPIRPAA